jgi:hypothetical protein
VQAEFFFAVELAEAAGGGVIEQTGGRHQTPGVQVTHADVGAVNIIVIHVQTQFRAFQLGVELAAEHVEAQGLGLLQGLGADQAFGLQAAFIAGVADAGDLSHGESPYGLLTRRGLQPIDFLYASLLCKVRLCSPGVIAMKFGDAYMTAHKEPLMPWQTLLKAANACPPP